MTKRYKITLKLLSPVHIGTGEDFEPMNYVIDETQIKNTKFNALFEFDPMKFFSILDEDDKKTFSEIAEKTDKMGLLQMYSFVANRKELIKNIAKAPKIFPNDDIVKKYNDCLGKINENGETNLLIIEKTYSNPNTSRPLIPGSSIKGAISTAVMTNFGEEQRAEIFKNLNISDSKYFRFTKIGIAKNIKRKHTTIPIPPNATFDERIAIQEQNEKNSNDLEQSGLEINYQYIDKSTENTLSEFTMSLNKYDKVFNIAQIAKCCNEHYLPLFKAQFNDEYCKDEKYLSQKWANNNKGLELKENQFLLRIGKHSGKRAVTNVALEKEESTVWLIDKMPFGWVLCTYDEI